MQKYELRLTTEDGELLCLWTIGDADSDVDVCYPIRRMGPAELATQINHEIQKREGK